eukprot:CAMPEP_0198597336 /NCGR_PEP_ID=MMETSP1462-20131121/144315_1 /TAXON_ID=1333877 /ORGANISM="Brandtodinium nutriculum, Strain RCC3387" /LENGTH=40 /DNA_ID= /DNA_START= /DNA_END= /DNA_ORIENTATION=
MDDSPRVRVCRSLLNKLIASTDLDDFVEQFAAERTPDVEQ